MYVWVFMGNLGDGKTFGMSTLAHYFAARARRAGLKVDIYANYEIQGGKPLFGYKDFFNVARSQNSICLMDEAHVNLDSRMFHKGSNIYMTQFFFYLRKLHTSLFMTTPNIRNLDSRIRMLTNILVICRRYPSGFLYEIYDYQGEKLLAKKFMPRFVANQIFKTKMYDTDTIIRNVGFPSTEREFDRFLTRVVEIRESAQKVKSDKGEDEEIA